MYIIKCNNREVSFGLREEAQRAVNEIRQLKVSFEVFFCNFNGVEAPICFCDPKFERKMNENHRIETIFERKVEEDA